MLGTRILFTCCITWIFLEVCKTHRINQPKILTLPENFVVRRGSSVTLPCHFRDLGRQPVLWVKGSPNSPKGTEVVMEVRRNRRGKFVVSEVFREDVYSGKFSTEGASLVINNLETFDQGVYTCTPLFVPDEAVTHSVFVKASQRCQISEFACDGKCVIPCDGNPDCGDGADETTQLCSQHTCSTDDAGSGNIGDLGGIFSDVSGIATKKFRCNYGGCIALSFKCNGRAHCWDGSDETSALCKSNVCKRLEFKCSYGGCIRRLWRCDGKADCNDGSDETLDLCKNWKCSSRKPFKCDYGACIEEKKKCNGVADCADNSDESKSLCGTDHSFTPRIDTVGIPEAETNPKPATPPPTHPPLPTKPPQPSTEITVPPSPPPTPSPSTSPTPPSDPCLSSSMCTCPGSGICVPCDRLGLCSILENGPKCSLPQNNTDTGITVDVLACGSQAQVNVAVFSRNHEALCSSKEKVPLETVVLADCWGAATLLAQCREDGKWHPYGNHLQDNTMEPTFELCQPKSVNSLICGRRPRYRRPKIPNISINAQQQWPWLASIYRNHTYACTATVISQDYVLTAGHCVTTSEVSTTPVNLRSLVVGYLGADGSRKTSFVTGLYIYPNYEGGRRPSKDIALLKLESTVRFSHKAVPACVSTEGFPNLKIAATFDRTDEKFDIWETVLQNHDPRCSSSLDRCTTPEIEPDQFCAIDKNGVRFLPKGSSGGPYLVNMGNDVKERWTVAGVVSSSSGVYSCKKPFTIFTRVIDFWSWIDNCVHHQSCPSA